jgi:hypothetical protein
MRKIIAVEKVTNDPAAKKCLIDLAPPMAMKLMFIGSRSFLKQNSITSDWRMSGVAAKLKCQH